MVLLWVTIRGRDLSPFSHYPMFSGTNNINNIAVYRLALEKKDGTIEWWESEFYRYPEFIGKKLSEMLSPVNADSKTTPFYSLQKNKLLNDVIRLMTLEGIDIKNYNAFHIIKRTTDNTLEVYNRTIDVIPISTLQYGASA